MSGSPFDDDALASLLGDLDGPMIQPKQDRIDYLGDPVSRNELLDALAHVYNVNANMLLADTACREGNEVARLQYTKIAFQQNAKILAAMRELLNAGVDPEWNPHE